MCNWKDVTNLIYFSSIDLQLKLNEEKSARQKSDKHAQEKEREISMLRVDHRQIQQRLQKTEGEFRQVYYYIVQCKLII